MTKFLAVSDLDHTLIWPARDVSLEDRDAQVCVERRIDREQSFVAESSLGPLGTLARAGVLVPVTARTQEQFDRVRLPGPPARFVACLNGARLLVDGRPDLDYEAHARALMGRAASFGELRILVQKHCNERTFVRRIREADDSFLYLLHESVPPNDWIVALTNSLAKLSWTAVVERRRTYVVPTTLGKEHAVAFLLDRLDGPHLVAAGDGLLDHGMLRLAARAIVPRGSPLCEANAAFEATSGTGTRAGSEIAAWMERRAADQRSACS